MKTNRIIATFILLALIAVTFHSLSPGHHLDHYHSKNHTHEDCHCHGPEDCDDVHNTCDVCSFYSHSQVTIQRNLDQIDINLFESVIEYIDYSDDNNNSEFNDFVVKPPLPKSIFHFSPGPLRAPPYLA